MVAKIPTPSKEVLSNLYSQGLGYEQIAQKLGVGHSTVHRWMKFHNIEPRTQLKEVLTYGGLHARIKRLLPKPALCQNCNKVPPRDLANISQEYKYTVDDWEWLCRSCHMNKDGRSIRLMEIVRSRTKQIALCGRPVVANGICMQQYNYLRRRGKDYSTGSWPRRSDRSKPCPSCQ